MGSGRPADDISSKGVQASAPMPVLGWFGRQWFVEDGKALFIEGGAASEGLAQSWYQPRSKICWIDL